MIDVEIEGEGWGAHGLNLEALSATAAMAVLQHRQIEGGVTILLTDNDELTELNFRFRNLDKPTNVLAFPAGENPENHLGDIAVAYGVCAAEAELEGKSLNHHLQHLVTHGVLHLLGYDHETDAQAAEMEGLERQILAGLGIADPYAAERGDDG